MVCWTSSKPWADLRSRPDGKAVVLDPASVTVTIFGSEYTLKGDADPAYVREVARIVDERMREVAGKVQSPVLGKVAILAAVNLADEMLREKRLRLETEAAVEDRSIQIARLLDMEMKQAGSTDDPGDALPGA